MYWKLNFIQTSINLELFSGYNENYIVNVSLLKTAEFYCIMNSVKGNMQNQ